MSERTNEPSFDRSNERTIEHTIERTNDRTNNRTNELTIERTSDRTNEHPNDLTKILNNLKARSNGPNVLDIVTNPPPMTFFFFGVLCREV